MTIPDPSLVILIGAAGAGKSTFAHKHFRSTEILSSDECRALVSDDENDQSATQAAFEVLRCILVRRLRLGRLTVIDATNVQRKARRSLLKMAQRYRMPAVAIVLHLPEEICVRRNLSRPQRCVPLHAIWTQSADLQRSLPELAAEGFREVWILNTPEEIARVRIGRAAADPLSKSPIPRNAGSGTPNPGERAS